jgi:ribosomal protein S18 acetylase RimI-like enzyme
MSVRELDALARLEKRVIAADGGRLKLEWDVLRARRESDVHQFLAWQDGRLVGFVGLYAFGPPTIELAGAVDPAYRRRGIGTELLVAAFGVARARGFATALLVTPRNSAAGTAFARAHGGVLEHSEHALVQHVGRPSAPDDPRIALRPATPADEPAVTRVLETAFGGPASGLAARLDQTLVIERDGAVVGTLRAPRSGPVGGIYGFGVAPELHGQGIGREALRRACAGLRAQGATEVRLEVAVENDRALRLYTSLGFERATTEDYFECRTSV